MKILIYGAAGQLGHELMRQGRNLGLDVSGSDQPQTDLTDPARLRTDFSHYHPALVINAAAYTHVDAAESEPELAMAVNKDGPAHLARLCAPKKIPLIHISTDYVFDGTKRTPYRETDPISPLGVYGRSKAAGDTAVRNILAEHIILRTAWLYGSHGQNFVKTILKLARERNEIQVVSDQYGCPTCAADLAEAILTISSKLQHRPEVKWGTYHYCGKGIISWYDLAQAIVDISGRYGKAKTTRVEPIKSADYASQTKRPAYSALDCSRIAKNFGILQKPWRPSLEITLQQLCAT